MCGLVSGDIPEYELKFSMDQAKLLKSIGKRIKLLRIERDMTQEDLAASAGIDRSYISSIETGKTNPKITTLYKLARALDVELSTLFEKFHL